MADYVSLEISLSRQEGAEEGIYQVEKPEGSHRPFGFGKAGEPDSSGGGG
jgi:hypothetical protein